ncbi:hypothetical protein CBM2637_A150005 [Cupriavidus taiwanensis]|nr:hypothetical protein CBM2637_A150005 [Cupriavidus taiwanensis]
MCGDHPSARAGFCFRFPAFTSFIAAGTAAEPMLWSFSPLGLGYGPPFGFLLFRVAYLRPCFASGSLHCPLHELVHRFTADLLVFLQLAALLDLEPLFWVTTATQHAEPGQLGCRKGPAPCYQIPEVRVVNP